MIGKKKIEWRLILPLVVLYIIGIVGFWGPIYIPPLAKLAQNGVNSDWLGFIGNIIGASITLIVGGIAWWSVQQQIRAQSDIADDVRAKKEFAARAVLPLALSSLKEYVVDCVYSLDQYHQVRVGYNFGVPSLPLDDIQEIKLALEQMSNEPAEQLAATLHHLQIQHDRLAELKSSPPLTWALLDITIQGRMVDTLDLDAFITRSFVYARGADYVMPEAEGDELQSVFNLNKLSDVDYPLVMSRIASRSSVKA